MSEEFSSKFRIPTKMPGYLEEFIVGYLRDYRNQVTPQQAAIWVRLATAEWEGFSKLGKPAKPRAAKANAGPPAGSGCAAPSSGPSGAPMTGAQGEQPLEVLRNLISTKVKEVDVRAELLACVARLGM